jgi:hypothetical protein
MRRWSLLPLLLGSTLVACSANQRALHIDVKATTTIAATVPSIAVTTAVPVATSEPATSATPTSAVALISTTTTTTTTAATTTTTTAAPATDAARVSTALYVAQALANAFANSDWTTARTLGPQTPEWSDRKYEQGFAGLDAASVALADSDVIGLPGAGGSRVDMWLVEVAHEVRSTAQQTTVYCVHWAYLEDAGIVQLIAGKVGPTWKGYEPPGPLAADSLRGCARFDLKSPTPAETAPVPPITTSATPKYQPSPVTLACPSGRLDVQIVSFSSSQPFLIVGGPGWVVRAELVVTNSSTDSIQLRGASPHIAASGVPLLQLGTDPQWADRLILASGESIHAATRAVTAGPPSFITLTSIGGWWWPDFPTC